MKNTGKSCNDYYNDAVESKTLYFYIGIVCLVLSVAAIFLAVMYCVAGLILSLITGITSVCLYKKTKNPALMTIYISVFSFLLSLLLLIINVCYF